MHIPEQPRYMYLGSISRLVDGALNWHLKVCSNFFLSHKQLITIRKLLPFFTGTFFRNAIMSQLAYSDFSLEVTHKNGGFIVV